MSSLLVIRYSGSIRGPNVVDPLLSTVEAKLERGRVEMDEHALIPQIVTMEIVHRSGVRNGQLVEVHDALQGGRWRGKIVGVTHKAQGAVTTTTLDIKRFAEV